MDERAERGRALRGMSQGAQAMVDKWRDEVAYVVGRDPLRSVPFKRGTRPPVKYDPGKPEA